MSIQFTPGNVKFYKAELTNSSGTALDITPQIKNISIFENMDFPTVYCEVLMEDSIDLWRTFPIIGEEMLEVSYKTPSVNDITTYKFRVYKIKNKVDQTNSKTSTYVLECVSEETVKAITFGRISDAFEDPVEHIVAQILVKRKYLKSSKSIFAEETKGIGPIAIPNLYPFQAIDFLKQRAVSTAVPNSSYKFYENQHGFHFRTVESLLTTKRNDIGSKEFTYDNSTTMADKALSAGAFRNIIVLDKSNLVDVVRNVGAGSYRNVTENFDMITKQIDRTEVNFAKTANQFISSDRVSSPFNTQKFFSDLQTDVKKAKTFFGVRDSSQTTNPLPDSIGKRNAYNSMFGTLSVNVLVYGDSSLTVGETLKLNTKNTKGTTERNSDESKISGTYLITGLRHLISPGAGATHYTAMILQKMGFSV